MSEAASEMGLGFLGFILFHYTTSDCCLSNIDPGVIPGMLERGIF
jgi:hypothetical protein